MENVTDAEAEHHDYPPPNRQSERNAGGMMYEVSFVPEFDLNEVDFIVDRMKQDLPILYQNNWDLREIALSVLSAQDQYKGTDK